MVSIVVPNYNHQNFLKIRLETILSQTYTNFEVIILDDCSSDNSKDVIEQFRSNNSISHIVYNSSNSGSTFKQWKKGIELAKGDFIWIAESDDFCDETFLSELVSILNTDLSLKLAFCQSNQINEKGEIIGDMHFWTDTIDSINWNQAFLMNGQEFVQKALLEKNVVVNASGVVFRRDVALQYIDEILSFKMCGDWLFWGLLAGSGKIGYTPNKHNYFRQHNATTRNRNTQFKHISFSLESYLVVSKLSIVLKLKKHPLIKSSWLNFTSSLSGSEVLTLNTVLSNYPINKSNILFNFITSKLKVKLMRLLTFK